MRFGLQRPTLLPEAFLNGRVVLPWVAVWVAFSCSSWFGLPDIEGLAQVTAERIVFAGVVGYVVVSAALRRRPVGYPTRFEVALWLLVIVATISGMLFGGFSSGYAGAGVSILLNFLLFPAVAYSILLRTRYSERDLGRFCLILTLFGAYLGLTAILERTSIAPLLIPPDIGDRSIVQHWGRSRGPFLQAEFNGAVMVQLLPVALLLLAFRGRPGRLIACVTVPLLCLGVYFTETRAALLSLGLVGLIGALRLHPGRAAYRTLCFGLLVVAVAVVTSGGVVIPRMDEPSPLPDRLNLFLTTASMIAARPLLGVGFGNFDLFQEEFFLRPAALGHLSATTRAEFWAGGTHNTLLTPAAELGILAGGLYLTLLIWGVVSAWRRTPRAAKMPLAPGDGGLPTCAFLVGVAFVVNAVFVELRFALTPNALLWVFIALVQRQGFAISQSVPTEPNGPRVRGSGLSSPGLPRRTSPGLAPARPVPRGPSS